MNLSRCVCSGLKPRLLKPLYSARYSTAQAEPSEMSAERKFEEILSFRPRVQKRKPAIEPFAKGLFVSMFNTDMLAFPEILEREDFENLHSRIDSIKDLISDENQTDDDVRRVLKDNRIYGAPATVFQGGLEANCTERLRIMEEIAKYRVSIANEISAQWSGISCLRASGADSDFDHIIPEIANGNSGIRSYIRERLAETVDVTDVRATATPAGGPDWKICGEKLLHSVGLDAVGGHGYMVLVCGVQHRIMQTFLVEPNAPGVSFRESTVTFSDTPATILGIDMLKTLIDMGPDRTDQKPPVSPMQIALSYERLQTAATCVGLLNQAIVETVKNIKGKFLTGKPFSEIPLLRNRITDAVTVLYTAESMIYLTAGLQDGYEDPDIELEAILCRIFATRETARVIHSLMETLKPIGLDGKLERYAAEARQLLTYEGQNDSITVYGALLGIQYSGITMQKTITKLRNPMFHSMYILRRIVQELRNKRPARSLGLPRFLHPSLMGQGTELEDAVLAIRGVTERALGHHGQKIVEEHRDLQRLTEIVMRVYGITACLSRASRSYCIGVRCSERELYQTGLVTQIGSDSINKLCKDVHNGYHINGDRLADDLAEDCVKEGKIPMEHSLTRVFF